MMKRRKPEHKLQVAVIDYLTTFGRPELKWFAIPNGDIRHLNAALRLKAEGVKPGVADLCIMLPYGQCAWLELKDTRGHLSDEQRGFGVTCVRLGHLWEVAYSLDDAIAIFAKWKVLRPEVSARVA
jgi:hypothetical protein